MHIYFKDFSLNDANNLTVICSKCNIFLDEIYLKINEEAISANKLYVNKIVILKKPETDLHPDEQRKLAKYLASLVNKGIKVFITTHSDYILKEFNTLIMLSAFRNNEFKHDKLLEKLNGSKHFKYNKDDYLYIEGATLFDAIKKTKKLIEVKKNIDFGFENCGFNDIIDDMNNAQEIIYYMEAK
jgi:ABC-type multidrug transport system ATPase subunit